MKKLFACSILSMAAICNVHAAPHHDKLSVYVEDHASSIDWTQFEEDASYRQVMFPNTPGFTLEVAEYENSCADGDYSNCSISGHTRTYDFSSTMRPLGKYMFKDVTTEYASNNRKKFTLQLIGKDKHCMYTAQKNATLEIHIKNDGSCSYKVS